MRLPIAAVLLLTVPAAVAQTTPLTSRIDLSAAASSVLLIPDSSHAITLVVRHTVNGATPVAEPTSVALRVQDAPRGVAVRLEPDTLAFTHGGCACAEQHAEASATLHLDVAPDVHAAKLLRLTVVAESDESPPYAGARASLDIPLDIAWIANTSVSVADENLTLAPDAPTETRILMRNDGNAPVQLSFTVSANPSDLLPEPLVPQRLAAGETREIPLSFPSTAGVHFTGANVFVDVHAAYPMYHEDPERLDQLALLVLPPPRELQEAEVPGLHPALVVGLASALALVRRLHA